MASIESRKGSTKPHRVRWRDPDGAPRSKQFTKKEDALRRFAEVQSCEDRGVKWEPTPESSPPDLEKVWGLYIENKSLRLAAYTLERYAMNLDIFMRFAKENHINNTSHLTKGMLEHFYAWLLNTNNSRHYKLRGADTARKIVEVVQLAWIWGFNSEIWGVLIPPPKKIEMVRSRPRSPIAPTWQEMDACVYYATGWNKKLLTVLRYTGLRASETMLLRKDDLDFDRLILRIRPEITKDREERYFSVSKFLVEEVVRWEHEEDWLIPTGRQGHNERKPRARDTARAWARAVKAGLARQAIAEAPPHHCFRRGIKSGLIALGGHLDAIDYLQGHEMGMGSRSRYIDPMVALPLRETVALIPKINHPLFPRPGHEEDTLVTLLGQT